MSEQMTSSCLEEEWGIGEGQGLESDLAVRWLRGLGQVEPQSPYLSNGNDNHFHASVRQGASHGVVRVTSSARAWQ